VNEKIDRQEIYRTKKEDRIRKEFVRHFRECPISDDEILQHLGLFISSKNLSRILFLNHLYATIIDVSGIIMYFGTRWGADLAIFSALRGIYEPFNVHRKIVGFDTFRGFRSVSDKDNRTCPFVREGGLSTSSGYWRYLEKVMKYHEDDNPASHIKKYAIRVGDASREVTDYLQECPETIVALAFFDMDLYEPTKKCLEAIRNRLVKGSVVVFDELSTHDCPGETRAVSEIVGLNTMRLERLPYSAYASYFVVE